MDNITEHTRRNIDVTLDFLMGNPKTVEQVYKLPNLCSCSIGDKAASTVGLTRLNSCCVKLRRELMFLVVITLFCFVVALNLLLAGATGRLYKTWSRRRGSPRIFLTISSPAIRLVLSFLGFVFLLASLYWGRRALVERGLW